MRSRHSSILPFEDRLRHGHRRHHRIFQRGGRFSIGAACWGQQPRHSLCKTPHRTPARFRLDDAAGAEHAQLLMLGFVPGVVGLATGAVLLSGCAILWHCPWVQNLLMSLLASLLQAIKPEGIVVTVLPMASLRFPMYCAWEAASTVLFGAGIASAITWCALRRLTAERR